MLIRTLGSAVYEMDVVNITVEVNVGEGNGVGYFLCWSKRHYSFHT